MTWAEQPPPVLKQGLSIQRMVRDDLLVREQVGIQRYGTPLQAGNGRDALRDAYEEALDLACYLRQVIEERNNLSNNLQQARRYLAGDADDDPGPD